MASRKKVHVLKKVHPHLFSGGGSGGNL